MIRCLMRRKAEPRDCHPAEYIGTDAFRPRRPTYKLLLERPVDLVHTEERSVLNPTPCVSPFSSRDFCPSLLYRTDLKFLIQDFDPWSGLIPPPLFLFLSLPLSAALMIHESKRGRDWFHSPHSHFLAHEVHRHPDLNLRCHLLNLRPVIAKDILPSTAQENMRSKHLRREFWRYHASLDSEHPAYSALENRSDFPVVVYANAQVACEPDLNQRELFSQPLAQCRKSHLKKPEESFQVNRNYLSRNPERITFRVLVSDELISVPRSK